MSGLSRGIGKDVDAMARRVDRIESFLAGFQRQSVKINVVGPGKMQADALLILQGKADDDARPLNGSYDAGDKKISLLGSYYQIGDFGEWLTIPPTAPAVGTHAYLIIKQDSAGNVSDEDVTIEVRNGEYSSPLAVFGEYPFYTTESRILIGEVKNEKWEQYLHGNLSIGFHQSSGSVARWPDSVGGSSPPVP